MTQHRPNGKTAHTRCLQRSGALATLALVALAGCATPYQADGFRGGYTDYPAGANGAVMVTFRGNGYSSASYVERMWHRRAAEVCGGADRYVVLDSELDTDTTYGASTSTTNVQVYGNTATATTTHGAPTRVDKHEVRGLVRCVNGGTYDPIRKLAAD